MELYAHWIYGLHPSDEMILGYISPENMFLSELDGKIASAVAVVSRQEKEYHDVPWKMNPADDEVSVVHILCVAPEFQKKGIAARTMRAIIEMSRESGKKAVHLDALNATRPPAFTNRSAFPRPQKETGIQKTLVRQILSCTNWKYSRRGKLCEDFIARSTRFLTIKFLHCPEKCDFRL